VKIEYVAFKDSEIFGRIVQYHNPGVKYLEYVAKQPHDQTYHWFHYGYTDDTPCTPYQWEQLPEHIQQIIIEANLHDD
jgi:hypothetical protein